jgi:5-methylthioadenosine/S-adenosylhomocysteine deaminase
MRYEKHIPKYMAFITYLKQGAWDIQHVCHLAAGKSSAFPCARLETGAWFMVRPSENPPNRPIVSGDVMTFDLILHNGIILTMNPTLEVIPDGIIAVQDGRIVQIGTWAVEELPAATQVIDACGGIMMPGLVNTHTHLPMTLFRGLADDLPLAQWLQAHIFPAESSHVTPGNVYQGALLGCAELLLGGTTTVCDGYFYAAEVAEAVLTSGLRAVVGQGVIDFPAPGVPDPSANIQAAAAFVETYYDRSPLVTPSVFCHAPYTCGEATLKNAKVLAAQHGLLFQIHAAETSDENKQPFAAKDGSAIRYLDRIGLLDNDTLLVHAVWVDDVDASIIAARKCGVSHCPESNMKLASGTAPVARFLDAGIAVGLGTDGCASNNDMDLFQAMDITAKLHKVSAQDAVIMDAPTVLKMATIEAARAIGLEHLIGSLEIGKAADIIVIDIHKPHLTPLYNPISQLVYAASGSDVNHVVIAGRHLVADRHLLHMDLKSIMEPIRRLGLTIGQGA